MGLAIAQFTGCRWHDWLSIGMVAGIFLIGQVVEGNFLTPKLVGDRIGLHPVWVIFALLAGGALVRLRRRAAGPAGRGGRRRADPLRSDPLHGESPLSRRLPARIRRRRAVPPPSDDEPPRSVTGADPVPQLPFDFGVASSYADDDFLVAASNAAAHAWIQPLAGLAAAGASRSSARRAAARPISGRSGGDAPQAADSPMQRSGRGSIRRLILARRSALLIDELSPASFHTAAERRLLHLYNLLTNERAGICCFAPRSRRPAGRSAGRSAVAPQRAAGRRHRSSRTTACCACCWRSCSPTASSQSTPTRLSLPCGASSVRSRRLGGWSKRWIAPR